MVKTKKIKSAGRFGARYGKTPKARLVKVEEKQRVKQKCPFCKRLSAKILSKGIWKCSKCNKKFASRVFYLEDKLK
ncbi:MAG: 50S ribosomal protein L37ae [Nanoarchaeota archaeon]